MTDMGTDMGSESNEPTGLTRFFNGYYDGEAHGMESRDAEVEELKEQVSTASQKAREEIAERLDQLLVQVALGRTTAAEFIDQAAHLVNELRTP